MDSDMSWGAGTASVVVTPDESTWLAGYAVRREPSKGMISDLRVEALALQDEAGNRLVIASMDIIAITKIIADPVIERLTAETGLRRHELILSATHTHYGPEFRPDKAVFFKIPPEYEAKIVPTANRLADALVTVIKRALLDIRPARLFARQTTAGFAHNRRRDGARGGNPSKEDTLDQDVPVLDCIDAKTGDRRAIVFGYACHNTTIPPEDGRYCADFAGFAKEQLERSYPGALAMFMTGCAADQNPEPRGSIELSRQYGKELGDAVEQSLGGPGREITDLMRIAVEDVPLAMEPVARDSIEKMLAAENDPPQKVKGKFLLEQLERGEPFITSYPAPLQVVRFGDALLMIAMSGETVVDWSIKFKRQFQYEGKIVWVSGYCNDMYGYIPSRRVQAEGGYEGGRANLWSWVPSPWTDDVEERITGAVNQLVDEVSWKKS
jgi:hypothetical protein